MFTKLDMNFLFRRFLSSRLSVVNKACFEDAVCSCLNEVLYLQRFSNNYCGISRSRKAGFRIEPGN
jgi:hypothetical protein